MATPMCAAGRLNSSGGFTLLELVVVMALLGILVGLGVPMALGGLMDDDQRRAVRSMTGFFASVREAAMLEGRTAEVELELGGAKAVAFFPEWVPLAGEELPEKEIASLKLPGRLRIVAVQHSGRVVRTGEAWLRISETGLSQAADILLGDADGDGPGTRLHLHPTEGLSDMGEAVALDR